MPRIEAQRDDRQRQPNRHARPAGRGPSSLREMARRALLILLGSAIATFGVHNVHEVAGITEGGVIGLVLCFDHWFGVPPSVSAPVLDAASYAVAFVLLGGGFLGWSAVATVCVAGFYRIWESVPHLLPDLSGDPLVASVVGAAFVGLGVGIVVRQGASSGGDDALALSLSKLLGWRVGLCYLCSDLTVLALSLTYIPVERIGYSLITVMLSSALIDFVKEGAWGRVGGEAERARG